MRPAGATGPGGRSPARKRRSAGRAAAPQGGRPGRRPLRSSRLIGRDSVHLTLIHRKALATMAQADAMETAKEVLRQIIKYRFWISIWRRGPVRGHRLLRGLRAVREAAAEGNRGDQGGRDRTSRVYASPAFPTKEYKPIVEEKTQVLDKDVIECLENALRPAGPAADLARERPGAVPELGPAMARESGPAGRSSWRTSTTSRPIQLT